MTLLNKVKYNKKLQGASWVAVRPFCEIWLMALYVAILTEK